MAKVSCFAILFLPCRKFLRKHLTLQKTNENI